MNIFTTHNGEMFFIPADQYDREVAEYNEARLNGDGRTMLMFEEGETGWEEV